MEDGRSLEYYMLRTGDVVEFRKREGSANIHYFHVKEKMKDKNKLAPRVFGISKVTHPISFFYQI